MSRSLRVLVLLGAFVMGAFALTAGVMLLVPAERTRPSSVGGAFQLVNQDGKTVTDADFRGKPLLVFFGFTHCPDICPTTLFEVSEVFNRLGKDAEKVNAIFVTVDPERDTPEKLKLYLSSFHPQISALSGTDAQIEAIKKVYYVYAKRVPLEGGSYTMDHTTVVYLMDKDGKFIAPFNLKRDADAAAADLKRRL
ncbi:MAG TPA: SCO family protein [Xanthobacteraceae bacterium]|nr:SCO family protein [Xanthobacteraceae bacterium]